jgi:NADPH:quinone reductase-like Zn-dependent oxidoreductase
VQFAEEHGITPVVGHELPFDRIADAHRLLEERRNVGKVVVTVSLQGILRRLRGSG